MRKLLLILLVFTLASCLNFDTGQNYLFLYDFENKAIVSQEAKQETMTALKKRFDKLGARNAQISLNNKNQIEIQFRTVSDEQRINSIVLNQGKLEFWETFKGNGFNDFIFRIDETLKADKKEPSETPFSELIAGASYDGGASIFVVKQENTAKINSYLKNAKVRALLDSKHRYAKFLWGKPDDDGNCELFAIASNQEHQAPINANHIVEASQEFDAIGKPCISIKMSDEGSARWDRITGNAFRERGFIAIVLNDIVYSAPTVSAGPITGGYTQVTGGFSLEEAQNLVTILSSGQSIPKLKFVSSQQIIKN